MHLDVLVGSPPKAKPNITCPVEYVEWLRNTLHGVYQHANKHLKQSVKRQKHYYDLKARPIQYKAGSYVWRWYPSIARGKLSKGWAGPYRVMECPTSIHCIIRKMPENNDAY